jgi:ATP-dependent Lon protease
VEGLDRARVVSWESEDPYFSVLVEEIRVPRATRSKSELEALARQVVVHFERYAKLTNRISPDATLSVSAIDDFSRLPDVVASNMNSSVEVKQTILSEPSPKRRLEKLLDLLAKEIEILEIERNINSKVRQSIDKSQREYYLREQMKAIQKELGDNDTGDEGDEYRDRILEAKLPEDVEKKALKELGRLQKMHTSSAESGVIRTYLDWLLDLPWNVRTDENLDLANASRVLDRDHYGLEKVKERMVEYLAVRRLRHGLHGPIICLAGPPGVGKTSIARSIAEALNRKYVRMSLAACVTRRKSAAIAEPMWAPCRAASSTPSSRRAAAIR